MVIERKFLDRIVFATIYSHSELLGPNYTHWSGYMTEGEFSRLCSKYGLDTERHDACDTHSLMDCVYGIRERDETLISALEEANKVGGNIHTHGAIPVIRTQRNMQVDFIIYNKETMRKQAAKTTPPEHMTEEYKAYQLICSMGYSFDTYSGLFVSAEENVFDQLISKQQEK